MLAPTAEVTGTSLRIECATCGAAIDLEPDLRTATFRYALEEPGLLARELGLPADAGDFEVAIRSRTAGRGDVRVLGQK